MPTAPLVGPRAAARPGGARALGLALVLAVLGEQVALGGPLTRLDRAVERALVPHRANLLADAARVLLQLGAPRVAVPLLLVGAGAAGLRWRTAAPLVRSVALLLALGVAVEALKAGLDRPAAHGSLAHGGSWPSGHAATAVVVWGCLASLLPVRWRWPLAVGVPLLVGPCLLLAGRHQVSDVLAGWVLGALLLALADLVPQVTRAGRTPRAGPAAPPSSR